MLSSVLLLLVHHALRQLHLHLPCTDLGPNIGLHFSRSSGVWRGSTKCRIQWRAVHKRIYWCSYYQTATILAIGHWDVGRL